MSLEYYLGLISGTSMDAIDAAILNTASRKPHLIATHSHTIPKSLQDGLAALCSPSGNEIERMSWLDNELGELFAEAAQEVIKLAQLKPKQVKAIGSHGQTIRHYPPTTIRPGFTLQIGNPNIIAERCGITTVADLRRRDMAVGGHGAPLVPAFHHAIFANESENRIVINIGGIANITVLPKNAGTVFGFDTGPGNTLMNAWAEDQYKQGYDHNGRIAASGKLNETFLAQLRQDPYFKRPPPKSTGREYFNLAWLQPHLHAHPGLRPQDIMASLCAFSATTMSDAIQQYASQCTHIIVCGGGAHNPALMHALQNALPHMSIASSAEYGIDPDYVEAAAFAWLAKQTLDDKAGNLPAVTGAQRPVVLGGIYKG